MNDVIELRGLRVNCIVGVLAEERLRAQPLLIDIDMVRPFEGAARHDEVAMTTNYADVIRLVSGLAVEGQFQLLETLARRAAREILALDDEVREVTVAVRKLRPPVPEDIATVGVRSTLRR